MDDKITEKQLTTLAIFMMGAIVAMMLFLIDWSWIDKRDYAAWVQAVFSVLGIGVAIWYPANREKRQERLEARRAIGVARWVAVEVMEAHMRRHSASKQSEPGDLSLMEMPDWLARLRPLDGLDLPGGAHSDIEALRRLLWRSSFNLARLRGEEYAQRSLEMSQEAAKLQSRLTKHAVALGGYDDEWGPNHSLPGDPDYSKKNPPKR
jgi:hypothetical protein